MMKSPSSFLLPARSSSITRPNRWASPTLAWRSTKPIFARCFLDNNAQHGISIRRALFTERLSTLLDKPILAKLHFEPVADLNIPAFLGIKALIDLATGRRVHSGSSRSTGQRHGSGPTEQRQPARVAGEYDRWRTDENPCAIGPDSALLVRISLWQLAVQNSLAEGRRGFPPTTLDKTPHRRNRTDLKRTADFAIESAVLPYQLLWMISATFRYRHPGFAQAFRVVIAWSRVSNSSGFAYAMSISGVGDA